MLRRDYLLKLIQDVFASIAALLRRDGDEVERRRQVEALYALFGGDSDFFRQAADDEMIAAVARVAAYSQGGLDPGQVPVDEMVRRIELLAALLYADFKVSDLQEGLRRDVAARSLSLYKRVVEASDTYSQERFDRIGELEAFLADNTINR